MSSNNILGPGIDIKPPVNSIEQVKHLAEKVYGIFVISACELNGYDDKNYHLMVSFMLFYFLYLHW